ncbi:MAG: methyltransferase domain-containing protein [Acidobacteriota bacterium]|nr:MAG: methyltransferase domain-containing protein [Acidobacteriota bacterium]
MKRDWSAEALLEQARSYQLSQPLLAAAELELFDRLDEQALSAEQLADALRADRRAITILLDALAALGVLTKSLERYALPAELRPLLTSGGETSVLAMLRHQATCAHRWDQLVESVRTGKPATALAGRELTDVERRAFIQAMHVIGRAMAAGIVGRLDASRFSRALDIGGGSGTYTIALLEAAPALRVTLFDLPQVVEMARERLAASELLDRVSLVAGDFYEDPLPAGHDLALLSAIVHQNSRSQNRELFVKCRDALYPGGLLVIRDVLMDVSHTQPVGGALFAINMLVATEGGGTYSFEELREDLGTAGFERIELLQRGEWMDSLVLGQRAR